MDQIQGETAVTIEAPAEAIYAYLLDFTRHPEWVKNLSRVEALTPGPARVGSRFKTIEWAPPVSRGRALRATARVMQGLLFMGLKSYSLAEITALEPGWRLAWTGRLSRQRDDFNRAEWEIVLEPRGAATRVVQRFRYLPQVAAAREMVRALGDADGIAAACAVSLAQLKHRLESQAQRLPQTA